MSDMKSNDDAQEAMKNQESKNLSSGAPQVPMGSCKVDNEERKKADYNRTHNHPSLGGRAK